MTLRSGHLSPDRRGYAVASLEDFNAASTHDSADTSSSLIHTCQNEPAGYGWSRL